MEQREDEVEPGRDLSRPVRLQHTTRTRREQQEGERLAPRESGGRDVEPSEERVTHERAVGHKPRPGRGHRGAERDEVGAEVRGVEDGIARTEVVDIDQPDRVVLANEDLRFVQVAVYEPVGKRGVVALRSLDDGRRLDARRRRPRA